MIQCKEFVPDVYTESEDFLCILRLLDLISNTELSMNNYSKLRDPYLCPSSYLPLLAEYVGYEYDKTMTYDDNRAIISAFPLLKKNKGNKYGIRLAIMTALKLSDTVSTLFEGRNNFVMKIDKENMNIDIQIKCKKYSKKTMYLINVVKPAGFTVSIKRVIPISIFDTTTFSTSVRTSEIDIFNHITTKKYRHYDSSTGINYYVYEINATTEAPLGSNINAYIYANYKYKNVDENVNPSGYYGYYTTVGGTTGVYEYNSVTKTTGVQRKEIAKVEIQKTTISSAEPGEYVLIMKFYATPTLNGKTFEYYDFILGGLEYDLEAAAGVMVYRPVGNLLQNPKQFKYENEN